MKEQSFDSPFSHVVTWCGF